MERAGVLGGHNRRRIVSPQIKVTVVCFLSMAFTMGAITNCSGIFVKPMSESLGYTRAELSMIYSLYSVGQVMTALLAGRIFQRFRVIRVMELCTWLTGTGLVVMGWGKSLIVFYICALLVGVGMGGLCMVPASILIRDRFGKAYGSALGIAMSGSGFGGMLFSYLFVNGMNVFGWRSCYFITAFTQLGILFPLLRFWLRDMDGQSGKKRAAGALPGQRGGGRERAGMEKSGIDKSGMEKAGMGPVFKNYRFWLFGAASVITYASVSTIHQSAAAYLSDLGCSAWKTSMVVSGGMLSLAMGKIVLGRVYDKTNAKYGTMICGASGLMAIGAMICFGWPPAVYVYILFFGLGYSFGSLTYPVVTEALFGDRYFAGVNGIYNALGSLALSAGVMTASAIYDCTGGYMAAFKLFFILSSAALAVYIKLIPGKGFKKSLGKGEERSFQE